MAHALAPIGGQHGLIRNSAQNMNAPLSACFVIRVQIKNDAADQIIVQQHHQDQLSSSRTVAALGLVATAGLFRSP